ncbi:MAG: transposase [Planctomycetota bacterium]
MKSWLMPRALRSDIAGQIYHALNRGNARSNIFFKDADFEAFEMVVKQGLEKYPVDLIAYQWMSNHLHMVLSPKQDKAMSAFLGWVTMPTPGDTMPTTKRPATDTSTREDSRAFRFRMTTIFIRSAGTSNEML